MFKGKPGVLPFPSAVKASPGEEIVFGEIHRSVRRISAALNRSQRQLNEITRILLEMETRARSTAQADHESEQAFPFGRIRAPQSSEQPPVKCLGVRVCCPSEEVRDSLSERSQGVPHPCCNLIRKSIQPVNRNDFAFGRISPLCAEVSTPLMTRDIVCFSHLRWDFVYQRPQHVLSRCHRRMKVHFWEEPILSDDVKPGLRIARRDSGILVLTPTLPRGTEPVEAIDIERELLNGYLEEHISGSAIAWYYTPMALRFSAHWLPAITVYDCMDELSAFRGAPKELLDWECELFRRADVVFTGGASLHAAKRRQHPNVHFFPSSVDKQHFSIARLAQDDPADQREIPHPRIGFFGVLDERFDTSLLRDLARLQPEWHFVLVGPVAKISQHELPSLKNIHYLGRKEYSDLPRYLAGWDVATLPFARNQSTRFISPTKTPEYLAAGRRVVSTPIEDVVRPYGELGLVEIAADVAGFRAAIARCLASNDGTWLARVDRFLAEMSWDKTVEGMLAQIERCGPHSIVPRLLTLDLEPLGSA
jgi:glycosyltransferase involved in cell wall biosynthesis